MNEVIDFSSRNVAVSEEAKAIPGTVGCSWRWIDYARIVGTICSSGGGNIRYVDSRDANGCSTQVIDRHVEACAAEILSAWVCRNQVL